MLAVLFRPFGCIAPKHFKLFSFPILRFITSPDEGYYSNVPDEDYYSNVPDEGYYNNVPDEGYYSNVPDEGYYSNVPDEDYYSNVPDEDYSRNALCALNLISTFLLKTFKNVLFPMNVQTQTISF